MYPNIRVLLIIGCTLPVSSAEAERSFSGLQRIKSYLRNRMSDEQLSVETNLSNHYVKFYIYHYEYQRLLIKPITISRPSPTGYRQVANISGKTCRPSVGQQTTNCRPTVDRQSADRFFGELFFTITNIPVIPEFGWKPFPSQIYCFCSTMDMFTTMP